MTQYATKIQRYPQGLLPVRIDRRQIPGFGLRMNAGSLSRETGDDPWSGPQNSDMVNRDSSQRGELETGETGWKPVKTVPYFGV